MRITPVACLRDNFAYLVHASDSKAALVVDPSEAEPVRTALDAAGLTLKAILNTHHHWDHVGGNEELLASHPGVEVYGHASDRGRIPGQSQFLEHGQEFECVGLTFRALHIPGHTTGAVAYVVEDAAFTGDTLFAAGCGRLFEGTPAMMHRSLNETLGSLPEQTRFFFGHEYTVKNLEFALTLEPDNAAVQHKLKRVQAALAEGRPSTPTTLAEERLTNPFMRCESAELRRHLPQLGDAPTPVEVLAAARSAKDAF